MRSPWTQTAFEFLAEPREKPAGEPQSGGAKRKRAPRGLVRRQLVHVENAESTQPLFSQDGETGGLVRIFVDGPSGTVQIVHRYARSWWAALQLADAYMTATEGTAHLLAVQDHAAGAAGNRVRCMARELRGAFRKRFWVCTDGVWEETNAY